MKNVPVTNHSGQKSCCVAEPERKNGSTGSVTSSTVVTPADLSWAAMFGVCPCILAKSSEYRISFVSTMPAAFILGRASSMHCA